MAKYKITARVPDRDELIEGLDLRDVHPALADLERRIADGRDKLARDRAELARLEGEVESLPARIHAGRMPVRAFEEARLARDRLAPLVQVLAAEVAADEQSLPAERAAATRARETAVAERRARLQAVADELAPVLNALNAAEAELVKAAGPRRGTPLRWPTATAETARYRALAARRAMASVDAATSATPTPVEAVRYDTSVSPPGPPRSPFSGRRPRGAKGW